MSTAMWKLEKDLCRCCHAEGSFKHLSDPCFQLGQEEIYSDMLQDCLDIKIVPMTGVLSDVTYTICESCVVRLRDAANFKQQVQDCEERFKEMYSKNLIRGLAVKDEPMNESDDLKQEFQSIDEDDDDAFMNFDDDGDDSLDDQPLSVEVKPKIKGKAKAKPKPKAKKTPAKKTTKGKPIKLETEDITEAAVSGEKKKGEGGSEYLKFVTITEGENGAEIYTCTPCKRSLKTMKLFSRHYKAVHLKKRKSEFQCSVCKETVHENFREKHMQEVHGREVPTCGVCGKTFTRKRNLEKHKKQYHLGEKNLKCNQCDKTFFDRSLLKRHQYSHSDVRNFKCDFCGKRFKIKRYLTLHIRIHMNDKRYVCGICQKGFVQPVSLKYHLAKHHPVAV